MSFRVLVAALFVVFAASACAPSGVGDPCVPEQNPAGGFKSSEAYIEQNSVQCRTRVCLVYQLNGDPNCIDPGDPKCATDKDVRDRVYCSCRCKTGENDTKSGVCQCPEGYSCESILNASTNPGVTGSYCVKTTTVPRRTR